MPFNCTISSDPHARHADGTEHLRVTIKGPPHGGKSKLLGFISAYYDQQGKRVRVCPVGEDAESRVLAKCMANADVVIVVEQTEREGSNHG